MGIKTKKIRAIDFFCGGGGMTHGLIQAGINVIAGVDWDPDARDTYEFNNPGAKFINADITQLPITFFEEKYNVHPNDDNMVFVGCSPCQFYSIIRSSKEKSRKTKDLLIYFQNFVEYYRPGYVLVENVPGIMSNKETVLNTFLKKLDKLGYGNKDNDRCVYDIVNMKNYGIPQNRRRFSLIATRLNRKVNLPEQEKYVVTVRETIGDRRKYKRIGAGFKDPDTARFHSSIQLSDINLERIKNTSHDGGSRLEWSRNKRLQLKCYIDRDDSFCDVYGRMCWDKPAPTITTKFLSYSNGRFGHPEDDRGLSVREGAALQSFPNDYQFLTTRLEVAAKIIGNAVPPEYALRLGKVILDGEH